ncbi:AraC family transcriptional regulator [Nocardioides sp. GXZ039]|uniref:AraC family transcriptional regulator n=1 Tax=Nocardioides sp. GXZ039 TaxID=3136018 RepID=UPI0030F4731F
MDAVAAMLSGQHAENAFVIRSDLQAPWSLRLEDRSPLTVIVLLRGTAVLTIDGEPPVDLAAGDAALVKGTVDYTLSDRPDTPPQALIGPGQLCTKPDGSPLSDFRDLGTRTWGNVSRGKDPETVVLTGSYPRGGQLGHRLVDHLPPSIVIGSRQAPGAVATVVSLLATELAAADAAQDVVLDRLVDLLTVSLLRAWFDDDAHRPAWYAAYRDPVVGGVLRRIHHEPDRPWSIDSLARDVGVSRATLARQFSRQVGEPVMSYLTRWRLDLAADLLETTDLTVESVATRVGYGSAFSLSAAFSRHHGLSPTAYQRRTQTGLQAVGE